MKFYDIVLLEQSNKYNPFTSQVSLQEEKGL